jgi:hypothetical protein
MNTSQKRYRGDPDTKNNSTDPDTKTTVQI